MTRLFLLGFLSLAACETAPERTAPSPRSDSEPQPAGGADTPSGERVGEALRLVLPTSNRGLFDGQPETFYQGLNTTVDSLRPEKWEGGQYGYVRDPVPTVFGRRTFRRVHEGIDIAPVGRDAAGEPVDTVVAIDKGRVVYANQSAGASSYGKYVVVEHTWSGSPVYSLYAHLSDVFVTEGEDIGQGEPLGHMGYTGRGLGRSRAHVHLEIALLVNEQFSVWFDEYFGYGNPHGRFFGTNLAGVSPSDLYLALERDPDLTFPEFMASIDEGYVIDLPGGKPLDLLERYPWLGEAAASADPSSVPAWRVAFSQEGVPIRVEVADEPVTLPEVEGVALGIWLSDGSTNRMLLRRRLKYQPARRGLSYFALVATADGTAPRW